MIANASTMISGLALIWNAGWKLHSAPVMTRRGEHAGDLPVDVGACRRLSPFHAEA